MRLFGRLYERVLGWSRHRHAPRMLAGLAVAEAVFFPVPPDVMLAPMTLAEPRHWLRFALLTTVASVAGGLVGYLLGHFAIEAVLPWLERLGWLAAYREVDALFVRYGFWIVFIAGFTPIPYKVFTIASGAAGIGLVPFVLGSVIGRGGRFFLVAGLIRLGGPRMEGVLRRYVEWLGWLTVAALVALGLWLELRR